MTDDAGIEPRTVITFAMAVRGFNRARLNIWFMITLKNGHEKHKRKNIQLYCNLTEEQIPDKFEIDVGEILRVQ